VRLILISFVTLILVCASLPGGDRQANWSADYAPCRHHSELLKDGRMSWGVRIGTHNQQLAEQFRQALDFWTTVLDMDWHDDDTDNCAIELVDGDKVLFEAGPDSLAARSQFPDRLNFQGWIVFNPAIRLDKTELYRISVHEIGHMLGLHHSASATSIMYNLELPGPVLLDADDMASLATHHKLRRTSGLSASLTKQ